VPFAQGNDPVETLAPQGSDKPFAKRVRLGAAHRRGDHREAEAPQRSDQLGGKDRVIVVDDETVAVV
jgi:hypothetical protein